MAEVDQLNLAGDRIEALVRSSARLRSTHHHRGEGSPYCDCRGGAGRNKAAAIVLCFVTALEKFNQLELRASGRDDSGEREGCLETRPLSARNSS